MWTCINGNRLRCQTKREGTRTYEYFPFFKEDQLIPNSPKKGEIQELLLPPKGSRESPYSLAVRSSPLREDSEKKKYIFLEGRKVAAA